MSLQLPVDKRRIIPRWRNSRIAFATGELVFSRQMKPSVVEGIEQFNEKLQLWHEKQNIETAADLVSAGFSQGHLRESVDAAKFLLDNSHDAMPTVLSIANELLVRSGEKPSENQNDLHPITMERNSLYAGVHDLKSKLNEYPRNPIMWVDLSRAYVILGQLLKAQDAMIRALILAPENRFVLRSAARLFVHLDEPDHAHDLLVKRDITHNDPWLLAAELATATVAGLKPRFIRNTRDILDRKIYHPFHTAELASALGTIELLNGSDRKARKLFLSSLISPTENSVAQSAWAKRWLPTLNVSSSISSTPRTYEARAWNALLSLDWQSIVHSSTDWFLDEPYSSRPAEIGAYAAAVGLEDYEYVENITREALIANPSDQGLINNLAFALANQDKLTNATEILNRASRPAPDPTEAALRATEGLINLRLGNIALGQAKYLDAIAFASSKGLNKTRVLAAIYYAREMMRVGLLDLPNAVTFAEKAAASFSEPDIQWLLQKLRKPQHN